jgi:hypothetical protein
MKYNSNTPCFQHYMHRKLPFIFSALTLTLMSACDNSSVEPTIPPAVPPVVSNVTVELNPHNALSTIVEFHAINATEARVHYQTGSAAEVTPFFPLNQASGRIATLGLVDTMTYSHRVEVRGNGGSAMSEPVDLRSGQRPAALDNVTFSTTGAPVDGFMLTAVRDLGFFVAFDGAGRLCWYRQVEDLSSRHVLQLEHGNFAAFVGWTTGSAEHYGHYAEFAPEGTALGIHLAPAPLYTDNHELIVTGSGPDQKSHLFSYNHRVMDMSAYGGPTDARIAGHQILRMNAAGAIEFSWDAWDYFTLEDWIEEPAAQRANAVVDFDHPNSLSIDTDGNYIVSWRHLAEVNKIDGETGEVMWRLGGRNNEFTILNDPLGGFNGQHSATTLPNGNLLLFDNGLRHSPPESRAVEYQLDTVAMTATLVWEYRRTPAIYTPFVGSVQRLKNGNTLIGFGWAGLTVEVTAAGDVVWQGELTIDGAITPFYRGRRIGSLYEYRAP